LEGLKAYKESSERAGTTFLPLSGCIIKIPYSPGGQNVRQGYQNSAYPLACGHGVQRLLAIRDRFILLSVQRIYEKERGLARLLEEGFDF
jgi:hypothetical protein